MEENSRRAGSWKEKKGRCLWGAGGGVEAPRDHGSHPRGSAHARARSPSSDLFSAGLWTPGTLPGKLLEDKAVVLQGATRTPGRGAAGGAGTEAPAAGSQQLGRPLSSPDWLVIQKY